MKRITKDNALSGIPEGLRKPLLKEFDELITSFREGRWKAAELSGGRLCEIVYTILQGYATGNFASSPSKPGNFVAACKALENYANVPRSFQILIPRFLPALYEIRNNRNVGHVGGDVNPDFMDSSAVVSTASWIVAELVRVFHDVSTDQAAMIVSQLIERRIPLIWRSEDARRVLKPNLDLKTHILLLMASASGRVHATDVRKWIEYEGKFFSRTLKKLHKDRLIEYDEATGLLELLPPGSDLADKLVAKHS